jgi:predicted helicase
LTLLHYYKIEHKAPQYLFCPKDHKLEEEYRKGFGVTELMEENTTGIVTMGDDYIVNTDKNIVADRVQSFLKENYTESELKKQYKLGKNYAEWIVQNKLQHRLQYNKDKIANLYYRPFDSRYTYLDKHFIWRLRSNIMSHMLNRDNVGLVFTRQSQVLGRDSWDNLCFISNSIVDLNMYRRGGAILSPLYLYDDNSKLKQ